ncbi:MAG: hypothetical protein GC157_04215 [Frankiales bacterium]|nr:hypothetical protein [Frankiales bacterium]
MPEPVCVRCRGPLRTPEVAGDWTCADHGPVVPLHPALPAESYHLADAAGSSGVPLWLPWPMPVGWSVSGVRRAGGTGPSRAVAVALIGPGVVARQAELVVVAEEPGVGLGASYAGIGTTDPGPELASLPADTKVTAGGHPTPLWSLPVADRSVYVGEAGGCWLWLVTWPVSEWMVVHDDLRLVDVRDPDHRPVLADLHVGPLSPRLAA